MRIIEIMASSNNTIKVIEVSQVTPYSNSQQSATELSLHLTSFDTFWLKFHPIERIFFYKLPNSTLDFFNSTILPKLKHSLSLALLHYLPLAGNLIWPPHANKPFIFYNPNDHNVVSVTVAESDADFRHLSEGTTIEAVDSRPYVPELHISDTTSTIIAFQITLFPNQGFCIGVSGHHAILDGKSFTLFMKAWAHLCKSQEENFLPSPKSIDTAREKVGPTGDGAHLSALIGSSEPWVSQEFSKLPTEITPSFDRTVIQNREGIDTMNSWSDFLSEEDSDQYHNPRSLKLNPITEATNLNLLVRGTFGLSREDIKKLREKVLLIKEDHSMHLSTFVLTYAYIGVTIFKAKRVESNKKLIFGFTADCRARMDPPAPDNYFGNCVSSCIVVLEAEALMAENGFVVVVERLSDEIKGLVKGTLKGEKDKLARFMAIDPALVEAIGVSGSTRFQVYGLDFGWGKPKKVEVTSIDRIGSISIAEGSDGNGGVEIGLVLEKDEMERFESLFFNGLKYL